MTTADNEHGKHDDDRPVEIKDVLNVPENDVEKPSIPSDQPSLPDFNS